MNTELQAAIEALPRYRDNAAGASQDPYGPYLWRADVLAALQAAPAPGSIDTAKFSELLYQIGAASSKDYAGARTQLVAHIDAHIAQRAASGDALSIPDRISTKWLREIAMEAGFNLNMNDELVVPAPHHNAEPYLRRLLKLFKQAGPAPIADEVAGFVPPGYANEADWLRSQVSSLKTAIKAHKAVLAERDAELAPRPPAPPASAPAAVDMIKLIREAEHSAPNAPAVDFPPLPKERYWHTHAVLFNEGQMRAYVLADRAARAAATPAGHAELDFWWSEQHGKLHISHSDRSDPAYKWKKGYTAPVAAEPAPTGQLYTCIGKGGKYELLGVAQGAGDMCDTHCVVYRDVETQHLYYRNIKDFKTRMEPIP